MHDYELTVVISPEVADEELSTTIEKVTSWITDKGGSITQIDQWGRRKLAYPIKRFFEGSYVLARFQSEPQLMTELEANLRMSEEVLRHLLVRVNE
ncbi:MAG: 30S ribosomal protein S6 [Dehalococcoidia bacterium]